MAHRAIGHHRVDSGDMCGAKIAPPHGAAGGVAADAGGRVGAVVAQLPVGRVGVVLGWEVPADDALVPTGIVPALVVAPVGSVSAQGQRLLCNHDAIGRTVGNL